MTIAYSRYFQELVSITQDVENLAIQAKIPGSGTFCSRLKEARERVEAKASLRIALIGEFSAGKSSLIGALTGMDVKIDADVCTTDTLEYSWQGVALMDTPGIQAEDRETNHDRIAREATVEADLVLFVLTNELFNPRLAQHLRFVLDEEGLGLAKKTALVVNKIDREANPESTLLGEILKVLGPHRDVPIYFCAASKWIQAKTVPVAWKERFTRQSRIPALIEQIDRFVDDTETIGRLTAPLQVALDCLEGIQSTLVESEMDKKRLQIIKRQREVLLQLQIRVREIQKTWKQQAYSTVLSHANPAVDQISDLTTGKDLEAIFTLAVKQASAEVDGLHDSVAADLSEALRDTQARLEEIGDSPLAREIDLLGKRVTADGMKFEGERPGGGASNLAAKLAKVALKPLQEGLEAAAKNMGGLQDAVYQVGKAMGKKFRPWEAVKLGKGLADVAGKVSQAVPFLAAGLDIYMQYQAEQAKDERERYLANMRIALRGAFVDQAKLEANCLEEGIVAISQGPVTEASGELDKIAAEIAMQNVRMADAASSVASLIERCVRLRSAVVRGVESPSAVKSNANA